VVQASVVDTGQLSWSDVARVLSSAPARIGRISGQGQPIAVGAPGELTLVDPAARRVFGRADLSGLSANSPYLDMALPGRVLATFHRGIATVLNGELREADEVARLNAAHVHSRANGALTHG